MTRVRPSFRAYARAWLASGSRRAGAPAYQCQFDKHVIPVFGHLPLAVIRIVRTDGN